MTKVVYLFGAGASQGSVSATGSSVRLLMRDLSEEINDKLHTLVKNKYSTSTPVIRFINEVIDADIDVEHVITFLEESGSHTHRTLAAEFRRAFREVLLKRLDGVQDPETRSAELYATLIDMHLIPNFDEELSGVLTLNYDDLFESAVKNLHHRTVDHGVSIRGAPRSPESLKILKLHGSFDWTDQWPIIKNGAGDVTPTSLWIPPGVQKAKGHYPFNVLWGMARELLDCDILRIVGCRLSANDWDLVSMLFTTKHVHMEHGPYEIEVIDKPSVAKEIGAAFPYLHPKSLIELGDGVGAHFIGEALDMAPTEFTALSEQDKARAAERVSDRVNNPFYQWLKLRAEILYERLESIETETMFIERFATSV